MKKSEVLGVRELQKVLRQLPADLQKNALAAVARAGAQELRRAAYAQLAVAMDKRSPREEDIIIKKRRNRTGKIIEVYDVGPPSWAPQFRWLHNGTAPHLISATTKYGTRRGARNVAYGKREGRILTNRVVVFGDEIAHPGQPARPWLKIATFSSKELVMRAMALKLRQALPKQVKKLVSKNYRDRQLRKFIR